MFTGTRLQDTTSSNCGKENWYQLNHDRSFVNVFLHTSQQNRPNCWFSLHYPIKVKTGEGSLNTGYTKLDICWQPIKLYKLLVLAVLFCLFDLCCCYAWVTTLYSLCLWLVEDEGPAHVCCWVLLPPCMRVGFLLKKSPFTLPAFVSLFHACENILSLYALASR